MTDAENPLALFERLARGIRETGYSVQTQGVPPEIIRMFAEHVRDMPETGFTAAGTGRGARRKVDTRIRSDDTAWIDGDIPCGAAWIAWMSALQSYLNTELFLGLFSFESHFARYRPGTFYKKHKDAFTGEKNRVLSVVLYLNTGWGAEDGGELALFTGGETDKTAHIAIVPEAGTLVAFLSEDIPHEVRVTRRERLSVAGWFRAR